MNRADFPILDTTMNDRPLVYLDNAATTQKPVSVLAAVDTYYKTINANVHRAANGLADAATGAFEAARETVRSFVNAAATEEIIFTSGTTAAINLVASVHRDSLDGDAEILITELEHQLDFEVRHASLR